VFVTLPSVIGSPGGCLLLLLIFYAPFVSPECINKFGHGIVNVTHPGVYPVKLDLDAIKTCRHTINYMHRHALSVHRHALGAARSALARG